MCVISNQLIQVLTILAQMSVSPSWFKSVGYPSSPAPSPVQSDDPYQATYSVQQRTPYISIHTSPPPYNNSQLPKTKALVKENPSRPGCYAEAFASQTDASSSGAVIAQHDKTPSKRRTLWIPVLLKPFPRHVFYQPDIIVADIFLPIGWKGCSRVVRLRPFLLMGYLMEKKIYDRE